MDWGRRARVISHRFVWGRELYGSAPTPRWIVPELPALAGRTTLKLKSLEPWTGRNKTGLIVWDIDPTCPLCPVYVLWEWMNKWALLCDSDCTTHSAIRRESSFFSQERKKFIWIVFLSWQPPWIYYLALCLTSTAKSFVLACCVKLKRFQVLMSRAPLLK